MSWTELIMRMLLCLLIAGIIGAVIGWLLRTLFSQRASRELEESWGSKLRGKEHELETLRADSQGKITAMQGQLADCNANVQTYLATISEQEAKFSEQDAKYAELQASYESKTQAYDEMRAEVTALNEKVTNVEAAATNWQAKYSSAEAALKTSKNEVEDLTGKLSATAALAASLKGIKEEADKLKAQNDALQKRVSELENDLKKAAEWESKYATLVSERHNLQQKVTELQASNQAQKDDWQVKMLQVSGDKDREIHEMQKRIRELEPFKDKSKDWEVKYLAVLEEKQKETQNLMNKVAELEPLSIQLAAIQGDARSKDAEINTLKARVKELETHHSDDVVISDLRRIEGIGPVYFGKLSSHCGINMQAELLERGKSAAGRKEIAAQSGIDEGLILRWVNHCDLLRIGGVHEQFAELLEAAGVDSIPELAQRNADNLHVKVVATNEEKHLSPEVPTLDQIRGWIMEAQMLPRVVTH